MAESRLQIVIDALNMAEGELKQLESELGGVTKAGDKQQGMMGGLMASWTEFNNMLSVVGRGVDAVKKVMDFADEGAQLVRLKDSSRELAASFGADMDSIVASLKRASNNTVEDDDAMLMANRAMMLGVSTSSEQLGQLMQVAASRGRAMGQSAGEAFAGLSEGIGRLSGRMLMANGIVLDSDAVFDAYAKSVGRSKDTLTETEKRQAMLNAVLKEYLPAIQAAGGLTDDAASKYERFKVATKEAGDGLKESFGVAMAPVAQYLTEAIDPTIKLQEAVAAGTTGYIQAEIARSLLAVGIRGMYTDIVANTNAAKANADVTDQWAVKQERSAAASRDVGTNTHQAAGAVRELTQANMEAQAAGDAYSASLDAQGKSAYATYMQTVGLKIGVDDVAKAVAALQDKHITITETHVLEQIRKDTIEWQQFLATPNTGGGTKNEKRGGTGTGGLQQATGGPLAPFAEVGEQGPEFIIGGVVIDAPTTRHLKDLGLSADRGFRLGGLVETGGNLPGRIGGDRGITGGTYTGTGGVTLQSTVLGGSTRVSGGGGGGDAGAQSSAQVAAQVATQAVQAAAEVAQVVPAAVQALVSQQTAELRTSIQAQADSNASMIARLDDILGAILRQGTAFDQGMAMKEAVQFLPPSR